MLLLFHTIEHSRLLLLPDEDIVNHGATTKKNSNSNQYARHNRRRWMELSKSVEDYTWKESFKDVGVKIFFKYFFMARRGVKDNDLPVRKIGIEMKKPPMAHTLETDDFCRYLFALESKSFV